MTESGTTLYRVALEGTVVQSLESAEKLNPGAIEKYMQHVLMPSMRQSAHRVVVCQEIGGCACRRPRSPPSDGKFWNWAIDTWSRECAIGTRRRKRLGTCSSEPMAHKPLCCIQLRRTQQKGDIENLVPGTPHRAVKSTLYLSPRCLLPAILVDDGQTTRLRVRCAQLQTRSPDTGQAHLTHGPHGIF